MAVIRTDAGDGFVFVVSVSTVLLGVILSSLGCSFTVVATIVDVCVVVMVDLSVVVVVVDGVVIDSGVCVVFGLVVVFGVVGFGEVVVGVVVVVVVVVGVVDSVVVGNWDLLIFFPFVFSLFNLIPSS